MSLFGSIFGFLGSGRAANSISNANIAAEHGVLDANTNGREDILRALGQGRTGTEGAFNDARTAVNGALDTGNTAVNAAGANINNAAGEANNTLAGVYNQIRSDNQSGLDSGEQGNKQLQDYASGPDSKFKFNYDDYKNDPAYQFELDTGKNTIENSAAARGLSQGGAVLADLTKYGQGVAATHYNDAFNRAKSQFDTNQGATLQNLQTLINSGNTSKTLTSAAGINAGNQISGNTTDAAKSNATLQEYLASLNTGAQGSIGQLGVSSQLGLGSQGLQGGEALANLGLDSATKAGNFAVGAGNAHADGIMNQSAALSSGVSDLAGLFTGLFPGLGVGKTGSAIGSLFG